MISPIFQENRLWGLMGVYQNSAPRQWEQSEEDVLNQASVQIGIALNLADYLTQVRIQEQQLAEAAERERTARFRCVLSLVRVKPPQAAVSGQLYEGVCEGRIQLEPKGQGGNGYDPLFVPLGHNQSFAELGEETKNRVSHRAKALAKLKSYLDLLPK